MSNLVFVQMSGAPGSGKTTLAKALAPEIDAVIIDHDVTKSALLDAEIDASQAGRASYVLLHALAHHLLSQGRSVIFDSPCFYEDLLARGQQLAKEFDAQYRYVECRIDDLDMLDRRLRERTRKPSQLAAVFPRLSDAAHERAGGETYFRDVIANMKRPTTNYLVVDTSQAIELYLDQVLAYIKGRE